MFAQHCDGSKKINHIAGFSKFVGNCAILQILLHQHDHLFELEPFHLLLCLAMPEARVRLLRQFWIKLLSYCYRSKLVYLLL